MFTITHLTIIKTTQLCWTGTCARVMTMSTNMSTYPKKTSIELVEDGTTRILSRDMLNGMFMLVVCWSCKETVVCIGGTDLRSVAGAGVVDGVVQMTTKITTCPNCTMIVDRITGEPQESLMASNVSTIALKIMKKFHEGFMGEDVDKFSAVETYLPWESYLEKVTRRNPIYTITGTEEVDTIKITLKLVGRGINAIPFGKRSTPGAGA